MDRSIYEFPAIFRRVHMERPEEIAQEVAFLKKVWRRHLSRPVRRVLDVACGDSPHGQLLGGDGIATVGVDRSATMIAAGRCAARDDPRMRFHRRPIENFRIPERKFDVAIFMSETFPVMTENRDLLTHLESVARVLRRGALYCIDVDRQDGVCTVRGRRHWRRREARVGPIRVRVREYFRTFPWHAPIHSMYELECRFRLEGRAVITRDIVPTRHTLPATIELLARASGRFKMVACYADLSFETALARCERRWMAVLRRL